jgi:hypothetical protein
MNLRQKLKDPRSEPILQYVLFTGLVVATPFVVVTKYLQNAVYLASHFSFHLFGFEVPLILSVAALLCLVLIIRYYRRITLRRAAALIFIGGMLALSHSAMDLYLDMSFFDLQQNWHYLAYGAYVFFFFRAFGSRGWSQAKMIGFCFASAVMMSTFDETFQLFFSGRVFDISDITKDAWGVLMALILMFFVLETHGTISLKTARFRQRRFRDYFRHPETMLAMLFTLTLIFVLVSPLLTEHAEALPLLGIAFSLFALIWAGVHFTRSRVFRVIISALLFVAALSLAVSYTLHRHTNITYAAYGMTIYRGIPIPFFDALFYPDGGFRLADKKHHFRSHDIRFFLGRKPDILLVGSGWRGVGGKGFEVSEGVYFEYNEFTKRGTQVIILPTPEACKKYNELKNEGKKVLFILHSTC